MDRNVVIFIDLVEIPNGIEKQNNKWKEELRNTWGTGENKKIKPINSPIEEIILIPRFFSNATDKSIVEIHNNINEIPLSKISIWLYIVELSKILLRSKYKKKRPKNKV